MRAPDRQTASLMSRTRVVTRVRTGPPASPNVSVRRRRSRRRARASSDGWTPPAFDGRELLAVYAGGAIGAVARVAVAKLTDSGAFGWPWATFGVNIVGVALLAYFATRLQERLPLSSYRRPLLGTGFCGALTTFSTLQLEVIGLMEDGRPFIAVSYLAVSVALGLVVVQVISASVRRPRGRI
jgi:CrcB protein